MAWMTRPQKRLQQRRDDYKNLRMGMRVGDDQFVENACPRANAQERSLIILVRNIIAQECGIPAEILAPSDKTRNVEPLMGGVAWTEFLFGGPYGFDPDSFFIHLITALRGSSLPVRILDKRAIDQICIACWNFKTAGANEAVVGSFASAIARELHRQFAARAQAALI